MKKLSVLLGFLAWLATDFALANAVVTSVSGTVQAAAGAAAPRLLRQGDIVRQGDTVSTGAGSSVVLKFDDGQVAALSANARLVVTAYDYNAQARTGNVLLSLLDGGMRAITGLIGRASPSRVTYRAGTATIGIRGTDVTIATAFGNVVVTVTEGLISFSFAGQTISMNAGQGVNAKTDGTFQQNAAQQIVQQLQSTPEGQQMLNSINGLQGLQSAITQASLPGAGDSSSNKGTTNTPGTNNPTGSTGGGASTK